MGVVDGVRVPTRCHTHVGLPATTHCLSFLSPSLPLCGKGAVKLSFCGHSCPLRGAQWPGQGLAQTARTRHGVSSLSPLPAFKQQTDPGHHSAGQ